MEFTYDDYKKSYEDVAEDDPHEDDDDEDDDEVQGSHENDALATNATSVEDFLVVRITDEPNSIQLAVQACVGLLNRTSAAAYVILDDGKDSMWLDELPGLSEAASRPMHAREFLSRCLLRTIRRCVVYSYERQQELLPNILTLGAVEDAIPIDENDLEEMVGSGGRADRTKAEAAASLNSTDLHKIDARALFRQPRHNPVLATEYMHKTYVDRTTAIAMLNPGYDTWDSPTPWNPALTLPMEPSMVDLVYRDKLFVTFLVNGGIPCTRARKVMEKIAGDNPWGHPVRVYGYANHWHVLGGFLFEAHTRLTTAGNMGAIPTWETTNLSFFASLRDPIERGALRQNPVEDEDTGGVTYRPDRTYVAFVVGDGDNIAFMTNQRAEWMRDRVAVAAEEAVPPVTWTISPHLARLAPSVLEWYYAKGRETGADYFMLPPSGHLYAYPASMPGEVQDRFVEETENDARMLDATCTINWEWFTTWRRAERVFLPKYGRMGGIIRAIFPSNVPYLFPIWCVWRRKQYHKVLNQAQAGDNGDGNQRPVVLFRPREWRGTDGGCCSKYKLSPKKMAESVANYPRGTVAYVYMSSDNGLKLSTSFMEMYKYLPDHVQLVSAETAASLALQASGHGKGMSSSMEVEPLMSSSRDEDSDMYLP